MSNQFLVPDPKQRGRTWRRFVALLEGIGYVVEWPEPTHAKSPAKGQQKYKTAADCIDFSDLDKSTFGRKKDLADATLRRVAKGMKKFVIDSPAPFIVPIANWSGESVQSASEPLRTITSYPKGGAFSVVSPVIAPATHQGSDRINDPLEPLPTVTCANRGELTLISPLMVGAGGPAYSGKPVSVDQPTGTLMTQNHRALASACIVQAGHGEGSGATKRRSHGVNDICGSVGTVTASGGGQSVSTAVMIQANGGFNTVHAKYIRDQMTTVTNTGSQQQLVTAHLVHMRGNCDARDANDPLHTISAGGQHHGLVSAFMERAFGGSVGQGLDDPTPTITAGGGGKPFTITQQVHMCGNSVSPPPMAALARANDPWRAEERQARAT